MVLITNSNTGNASNSSNALISVLKSKQFLPLKAQMEHRVEKAFPNLLLEEIACLTVCLIRFLELKVIMEEYSSNQNDHLLAATPILEEAWLGLYGDCELYPAVIMAIQQFHGQPKSHVFLRRETDKQEQAYFAKLTRTQSLMQCYYQTTMPCTLNELSLQANCTCANIKKKNAVQDVVIEQVNDDDISTAAALLEESLEYDIKPNDLPSVVVHENDSSNDDSDADSEDSQEDSTYASQSYETSLYTDDYTNDYTDTITQTSTLTNSTALSTTTKTDNVCVLLSHLWKRNCGACTTTRNPTGTQQSYQYTDYAKEPAQPVVVKKQQILQDDITLSVSSSSSSSSEGDTNTTPKRGKKRYQKLNRRWRMGVEDFKSFFLCGF